MNLNLSEKEKEIILNFSNGLTTQETGLKMNISPNTVQTHVRVIRAKMGLKTVAGIVGAALRLKILE